MGSTYDSFLLSIIYSSPFFPRSVWFNMFFTCKYCEIETFDIYIWGGIWNSATHLIAFRYICHLAPVNVLMLSSASISMMLNLLWIYAVN